MSSRRARLFVPAGALSVDRPEVESLRSAFDVVPVESVAEARRLAAGPSASEAGASRAWMLCPAAVPGESDPAAAPGGVLTALEHIGEGVGLIDPGGRLRWANTRLRAHDPLTRERFLATCRRAMEQFDQGGAAAVPLTARPGRRYTFALGENHYEVLVSIASVDEAGDRAVRSVVGILSEITEHRRLQEKIDTIDAAGAELMRIDAAAIEHLNVAERLALLEEKIIRSAEELLNFDKFEVRLIDRETNRLELVFNHGLTPLRIGEVMYAEEADNGISGFVAATGRPCLCPDTEEDRQYRPGLEQARSSLTVPLRLYDRVIGVFNVESTTKNAFNENDRRFAQIFARYIAMAMHILDLLVVQRYTANEQITGGVLNELNDPLEEIAAVAEGLRETLPQDLAAEGLNRILSAADGIRRRLAVCRAGPRSLLGAEQELQRVESDPRLVGKRVILADNEAEVREAISELLRRKGCEVTVCSGGEETIERLQASAAAGRPFDLIISDVRMPDRTGYEVFRTARECAAGTPVILITGFGYDPHHSIVRASQEGLHGFLFKPLQASQLLEAVTGALGPNGEPAA